MEDYAEKHDLKYNNFLELIDEVGIDFSVDTYDAGLHLNVTGAEKVSKYLGEVLKDEYNLEDHRNDEILKVIWDEKVDFYNSMKEAQYKEIEEFGYIKSLKGE